MWAWKYLIWSQFDIELENTYAITDYLGNLAPHQASIFEILVQRLPFSLHIPIIAPPAHSQSLSIRHNFGNRNVYQSQQCLESFHLQILL
jgi:hypothetical protein